MIDIKFIRENPSLVQKKAKDKNIVINIDHVLHIDTAYRELSTEVQNLQSEKNKYAKERNVEKGKELKELLDKKEHDVSSLKEELNTLLLQIPNPADDNVPVGKDESENVVIRKIGEPKMFDFTPKDHIALSEGVKGIDTVKASEISGARFNYLMGDIALLEFALIQFAFEVLRDEKILTKLAEKIEPEYSAKQFIPVVPPVMIRPDVFRKMARIDPEEERYYLQQDDLFLIGSAEHTLGPLHMNQTIVEKEFPIRYVGFSTAFRREAGSYGKDTKGILRVHQFDKVEMESFTLPENSRKEQDFIVSLQEYFMQALELPYQVVSICTGDMGTPDARQFDIETWIPSQNKYRETHTSDLMTDYQSRRLQTKVKRKDGTSEFVHMNDATAFAIGRTIIGIIENYQQKDGTILVPKVLQKYLGKEKIS